jgi:two-component system response regulator RegA
MNDRPPCILLVDDDELFTEIMARGFERRGFEVEIAHDADRALDCCAQFKPSHVLLDLNMPGKSGLLVLADLLALSPGARLLVLTGYSSIATAVEATKAGALNYLCKPATIDEILLAFEGGQTEDSAPVPSQPPSVNRLEWEHIQKVLQDNDGNISATARALGMHRRTLQRKLQKRPVKR